MLKIAQLYTNSQNMDTFVFSPTILRIVSEWKNYAYYR